jgi:hypothetical protein
MSQPWQMHPGSPWNWHKIVSQIWSGFIEIAPLLPALCLHFTGLISECFKWQCLDTYLCFVLCLSKQFQCILYLSTFQVSWYHCSPGDHSTLARLAEHSPSSSMVPQILCMSCQKAIPHNNIVLGNKIDRSVPDRTPVFKCHHNCTQVQNTCETDRVHPIAFVEVMSMPFAILHLPYVSASRHSKGLQCTRAPSSEHSLAVLYASKFHNLVAKANPHKHIRSLENDIMHWAPRKNWTSHNSCLVLHLLKMLCCLA